MRLLTDAEFRATIQARPVLVAAEVPAVVRAYLKSVPHAQRRGFAATPEAVRDMPELGFRHVLFPGPRNVFLVVVLEVPAGVVLGHHVLDLNQLYGVRR
ncbi:hypothetical protein [Crossiella sp. CA198]|uniref:hypothetical protein n=1 Tax=Crossiella sp. CA198 TaxID=3455607 RepID=UPI003F8D4CE6